MAFGCGNLHVLQWNRWRKYWHFEYNLEEQSSCFSHYMITSTRGKKYSTFFTCFYHTNTFLFPYPVLWKFSFLFLPNQYSSCGLYLLLLLFWLRLTTCYCLLLIKPFTPTKFQVFLRVPSLSLSGKTKKGVERKLSLRWL